MRSKEKNMDLTSTENEAAKKVKKADKWADKPAMEVRDLHFSYGRLKKVKLQRLWEQTDVVNLHCFP